MLRQLSDPAVRLHDAVQRYIDGLHAAAEHIVGPKVVDTLDSRADQVVPDVADEPAWPTLRAHLLALAAETGEHPLLHLGEAALGRDLRTVGDMAAVLNWRLPGPAPTDVQGPLPWLPGVPQAINDHPNFGAYLAQRSQLITDLADHVRRQTGHNGTQPVWAPLGRPLSADIMVKSPCGGPPTASTRTTADQPDQNNCGLLPPSGNRISTGKSSTSATKRLITASKKHEPRLRPSKVSGRMSETTGRRSPRPTVDRYHEAQACRRNT
jgi:hypothetical protein